MMLILTNFIFVVTLAVERKKNMTAYYSAMLILITYGIREN